MSENSDVDQVDAVDDQVDGATEPGDEVTTDDAAPESTDDTEEST